MAALTQQEQQQLIKLVQEMGLTPQQIFQDQQLLRKLASGEHRKDFYKHVKKVDPDRAARSMRDVEEQEKIESRLSEFEDKLDMKGAKAAKAKQDEQRAKLAQNYDEEQIKGIEEVATRHGLADLEAAAVLYAHEHPETDPTLQPPSPSERPGATWEFPTVRGKDGKEMAFKDFAADTRTHSLNEAYNVITEFKKKSLSPAFRR